MSYNSTKVPGEKINDFYSRSSNASGPTTQGTVVPDMERAAPKVTPQATKSAPVEPVVGFLYSISRQGWGEYWPLHVGNNKIGRSSECDICLPEATVSSHHADLNIKQMKTSKKVIASIRDIGSKTGIFVNDEELEYDAHNVHDKDVLTIGESYKLLVILIDAEKCGLEISENFQPSNDIPVDAPDPIGMFGGVNDTESGDLYNSSNRVDNGTVGMDGSFTPPPSSRTKFL